MIKGCNKYTADTIGGLNMLIPKEHTAVITKTRELIRRCLQCKMFMNPKMCDRTDDLMDFLDENNGE